MDNIIEEAYKAAKQKGYKGDEASFVKLLQSDEKAFNSAFLMAGSGKVSVDVFKSELKKKSTPQSSSTGSKPTQPTSGSKPAQQSSSPKPVETEGSKYLQNAKEAGWTSIEEYKRAGHRYKEHVPEEELEYIQGKKKKVIYRGTREEIEQQVAPQVKQNIAKSTASESTVPKTNIKTMPKSAEEGIGQAKISKEIKEAKREEDRAKGLFSLEDINEMDEDPNNFNLRYYNYFKEDADKSGDALKFSNDLRNKYADQFIDSDFKEEFSIANEMDRLREKMASELEKMSANGDPENPEFKKLIKRIRIKLLKLIIYSRLEKLQ